MGKNDEKWRLYDARGDFGVCTREGSWGGNIYIFIYIYLYIYMYGCGEEGGYTDWTMPGSYR